LPPGLRALGSAATSYPVSISDTLRAMAMSVDALDSSR
jgi:hypothetical protein